MWSRIGWFAAWSALIVCAFALRWTDLDRKPFHADEANQATKVGILLEEGTYEYDPYDHHGPTLYYAALPAVSATGRLDEESVRMVPLVAGLFAIFLLTLFRDGVSKTGLLTAGAFFALCPAMVYYSRYFVQEMMLVAFTVGFLGSLWRYIRQPDWLWALNIGMFVGLMHATKETFVLHCAAALLALPFIGPVNWRRGFRHLPIALLAAAVVSVILFSSFGTHWGGVVDSVMTYFRMADRAGGEGHEKPWSYYLKLLAWNNDQGLRLTEVLLLGLAVLGAVASILRRRRGLGPFFLVYTLVLGTIYSCIAYKTPWLVVNLIAGLALLAAAIPWKDTGFARWLVLPILGFGFFELTDQACSVSFRYHSDGRNPYAYTQTSTDLHRWLDERVTPLAALQTNLRVHVIHPNPWPLPWELRKHQVGYWSDVPAFPDADLILVGAGLQEALEDELVGSYKPDFVGLRTSEFLPAYIRADLWPRLIDPEGLTPEHGPFKHEAMSSVWQLHLVHDDRALAAGAARAAYRELDRIEELLSDFIPYSDISRIKNAAAGEAVKVSPETIECLQIAERMKQATDGAFDVAYKMKGAGQISINPVQLTVTPSLSGFQLDLGGIGKGYGLDKMAVVLREEHGIESMLLDAQSTALAVGKRAWPVGIRGRRVALEGRALSGSGITPDTLHIYDPSSGEAVRLRAQAWVLAPTGAEADALSTTAMIVANPLDLRALEGVQVVP